MNAIRNPRLALALAATLLSGVAGAGPARADWYHQGWGRWHGWGYYPPPPVVVMAPPRVIVAAPPPVVVAPPVFALPSINVFVPLRFR